MTWRIHKIQKICTFCATFSSCQVGQNVQIFWILWIRQVILKRNGLQRQMINTTYTIARAEKGAQITHAQRFLNDEGERLACRCQGLKKFSNCQVVTFFLKRHTIFFPFVVGNKLSHILEAITFHSPMQLKQSLRFSSPQYTTMNVYELRFIHTQFKIDLSISFVAPTMQILQCLQKWFPLSLIKSRLEFTFKTRYTAVVAWQSTVVSYPHNRGECYNINFRSQCVP